MGNLVCCCCDDHDDSAHRHPHTRIPSSPAGAGGGVGFRAQVTAEQLRQQQRVENHNACRICGMRVDSTFIDSHEESCRQQARARLRHSDSSPPPPNYDTTAAASSSSSSSAAAATKQDHDGEDRAETEDEACCICFEKKKNACILPCHHAAFCKSCVDDARVTACPLCREVKQGILILNVEASKCKICKLSIHPVFLSSHQEVCRLQRKRLGEKMLDEHKKSRARLEDDDSSSSSTTTATTEAKKCYKCRNEKHQVALVPCGCVILFCTSNACKESAVPRNCLLCSRSVVSSINL